MVDTEYFIYNIFFWPCQGVCGILVPRPEIEPVLPAVEVQSFSLWATREFSIYTINSL